MTLKTRKEYGLADFGICDNKVNLFMNAAVKANIQKPLLTLVTLAFMLVGASCIGSDQKALAPDKASPTSQVAATTNVEPVKETQVKTVESVPQQRALSTSEIENAAANAAIEAKRNAQPEMTSIQIVPLAKLVNKVFGRFHGLEDLTNGQMDWTLVAISGVVELRGNKTYHYWDVPSEGAKVYIRHDPRNGAADGAIVEVRPNDALTWNEMKQKLLAGQDLDSLPAEFDQLHSMMVILKADSMQAVESLHDGDPITIVGEIEDISSGRISIDDGHVPPPNEVHGDRIIVNRPISVRDLKNPWTW